ncbi:MAG: SDR family NAD(P)-dependent oxidoreductase, partial [Pseudomonadota bacterium]
MSRRLRGKTALVTGAGRGLGRACAEALAREGATVLAAARSQDELDAAADFADGTIEAWPGDVTDDAFVTRIAALPSLDILVNNAGGNKPQPFVDVDTESLDAIINLNVRAAFRVAQAAAR